MDAIDTEVTIQHGDVLTKEVFFESVSQLRAELASSGKDEVVCQMEYSETSSPEDIQRFFERFKAFVLENPEEFDPLMMEHFQEDGPMVDHEMDHARKYLEFGYGIKDLKGKAIFKLLESGKILPIPGVEFPSAVSNPLHILEIYLAPKDPSLMDVLKAQSIMVDYLPGDLPERLIQKCTIALMKCDRRYNN